MCKWRLTSGSLTFFFGFASHHSLLNADFSVAQLEELRAECDKELNNAIMMGDSTPLSLSCVLRVIFDFSGMEALAKSGVVQNSLT
jgi:hypothetical protein